MIKDWKTTIVGLVVVAVAVYRIATLKVADAADMV